MSEIKWIKITTSMFDDEKIDYIESLPDGDTILVIWIKLLTLAGKCNAGGYILLTENIPYTEEMLAHKFRRPINTVKLALATFEKLKMIERIAGAIFITNWEKHQSIEGMERIREQTRLRVQRYRERQKLPDGNVTCNVTGNADVTQCNALDLDIDLRNNICVHGDEQKEKSNSKSDEYTEKFQEFWKVYPRKKEKKRAFRCWKTRLKEDFKSEDLINAAKNYAAYCQKEKIEERFIKHAATFLGPDKPFEEYINQINEPDPTAATLEFYGKMG
ncbi:MAG: phage replisome organizer N-terminal domain-containing protein [Deltaproteobacteria bacterium]|nr:phage replisome organizer N-terminal domain-containing protein [Deltaproteobacteria bacterium]